MTTLTPDDPDFARRVQRILLRPAAEREVALDAEAGGDAALRAALARAVADAEAPADRDSTRVDASIPPPSSSASRLSAIDEEVARPGEEIVDGSLRYVLVKRLPGGGLGEVWVADQVAPVRRRVAIKFIRSDKYTTANEARFENERRVLASFDHPNIARFYDAGRHRERPWFAMEFIEGLSIDLHCERNGLSVPERIRLVQQVARAVQYAHDREIVHRDIKPGNVLVTAEGVPKLLDFGIAKLVGTKIDGHRGITTDFEPHTEEYASPEQLRAQPSTVRSDVYALGVMLYELLTEQLPYHVKTRVRERIREIKLKEPPPPMSEALEAVSDDEPVPEAPSTTGGTAGTPDTVPTRGTGSSAGSRSRRRNLSKRLAEIARRRNTRPDRLIRSLRGDLDNIVAKAMRIEPLRRYASPESLAVDLENHLQGLPVEARPESAAARLSRILVRNRWVVAGTLVTLVALAGVLASSFLSAQNRYLESERERLTAQREVLRRGWQDVGTLDAEAAGGLARSSGQLQKLRETLRSLEQQATALCAVAGPGAEAIEDWTMLADLRRRLGLLSDSAAGRIVNAGDPAEAARWLAASDEAVGVALERAARSGMPANAAALIQAQNARERGDLGFHRDGDRAVALAEYLRARGILDALLDGTKAGDPALSSIRRERSTVKTKIGDVLQQQVAGPADLARLRDARREVVDEYRLELEGIDSPRARVDLAIGLGRLADAIERSGGTSDEVIARFEEAVATVLPALNADSQVETRKAAADAMLWLGNRLLGRAAPGDADRAGQLILDSAAQYLLLTFRSPEESSARENVLRIQQGHLTWISPALALGILDAIRTARLEPDTLMTRIGPTVPGGTRTQIASTVTRAIAVGNGSRLAWHWRRENEFRRLNPPAVPGTDDEREAAERDRKSFERFTAEVAEAFLDSIRIARDAIASAEPDPRVRIEVVLCMAIALHPDTDGLVRTEPASPDQLARIEEWHRALEAAAAARELVMTGEAGEAWELAKEEWSRTTGSRRVSR